MNEELRNMKRICSLLHEIRQQGHRVLYPEEVDSLIQTAETIYHDMKDNQ